jgi:hypothetical protein
MIVVWMPVYNEARNLQKAIDSVLAQSFTDFKLVISNNFSTDGSDQIIDASVARDSRVVKVMPPAHVQAFAHMRFIYEEVLPTFKFSKYSVFIGGHDLWRDNLLQTLWSRAEGEPNAAIVYTDSYEADDQDRILKQFCGWVQVKDLERPYVPSHVLLGLTHNIVWGGLWRESMRQKVPFRKACVGFDHQVIAEMALLGDLIYQSGSAVMLRRAPDYADGAKAYHKKSVPRENHRTPILDFIIQLEWVAEMMERAVQGDSFCSQEPIMKMMRASLLTGYVCKYWKNLGGFEGGPDTFFNHPKVRAIMGTELMTSNLYTELVTDTLAEAEVLARVPE